jgi:hypothetical protein
VVYGIFERFAMANIHAATKEYNDYYSGSTVNVDFMRHLGNL